MRCRAATLTLALVVPACGFDPRRAAEIVDASTDTPVDAAVDAAVPIDSPPPAIVAVQSLDPGYLDADSVTIAIRAHAGNLLLAATYASSIGTVTVSDSTGLSWTSLPTYVKHADTDCPEGQIQFWYTTVTNAISTSVTIAQADAAALGMHVIEYSGVDTDGPIDAQLGFVATSASNSMTTGPITTTHFDATVALFADVNGSGTMVAGSGWNERGLDSGFYTIVIDNTPGAAAGTFTPSGTLPVGTEDSCWLSAAIALRAQ